MTSYLTYLACTRCARTYAAETPQTLCPADGGVLYARYDLAQARRALDRDVVARRAPGVWQIPELMPVRDPANIVTLGEGGTPLLAAPRLGERLGFTRLFVKEEGLNPTGSFKARGIAVAVSKAKELGVRALTIPTAGNAGSALAAYGARAGIPVDVFLPADTPPLFAKEMRAFGATLHQVDGLIDRAGAEARAHAAATGAFDISTLKEPYRCEGKKTMGYELAEQFDWELPDVIIYPTGGGTGLIGMWKAFDEMEEMGWIGSRRPRMVTVQAAGCAPIVRAFEEGKRFADEFQNAHTTASGLRVPKAIGDFLIIDALRASGGTAVAVTDEELIEATKEIGAGEGIFCAPEGAACLPALRKLMIDGTVKSNDRVVLFNTGSGVKYVESFSG